MFRLLPLCGLALVLTACGPSSTPLPAGEVSDPRPKLFDWPQWQGPERTAVSKETGLLADWSKDGPPLAWKAKELGGGYSTPSVAAGRVFGMSYRGDDEGVWAVDEATGQPLWWTRISDANKKIGYGEGPRCTPTVDGDVLYALGTAGDLVCLGTKDGKEVWHKNLARDFGGKMMSGWGYSESPLLDGDKLICTPGGKDATLLALDKKNGEVLWKAPVPGGDGAGYASPIAIDAAGHKQYVQFLRGGLVGVDAANGAFLWRYAKCANGTANCSTALYADGEVFGASDYGTGGGLVKLSKDAAGGVKADEVYFTKEMKNHHGGMILHDGYLYGANGGKLVCLEFKTGKVMWGGDKAKTAGKGSVALADGRLYYREEGGTMVLIEAGAQGYVEHGRFSQPDRSKKNAWPHPVVANGRLYLRDQDVLLCYDVKAK
jgi:outer membrane protein assembly factor BamB